MRDRTLAGTVGVLAAAALFSTSGTSKALLVPDAWPPSVAAVRLLVGAAGMVAFVLWRGWRGELQVLLGRPLVWLMALGVAGYQAFFFVGVDRAVSPSERWSRWVPGGPLLAGLLGWAVREGAPGGPGCWPRAWH